MDGGDDAANMWSYHMQKGLNGFEHLRKYIKQSNEMCRTVTAILQERVELESRYAKSLNAIGSRLLKASALCLGSMETAWRAVATSMMDEAEGHKCVAESIDESVLRPLKNLTESFHKSRKPIENQVEKVSGLLKNMRSEESRTKRVAFSAARDLAKASDAALTSRMSSKTGTEKEVTKMEKKCRTLEDTVRKTEKEYYDTALKAETSRLDWEATVYKSCAQLQVLEVDRLKQCHEVMKKFHRHVETLSAAYNSTVGNMQSAISAVSIRDDMQTLVEQRGIGPTQPEQLLVDFFAEDLTVTMERAKREHFLKGYQAFAWQDIERERRAKEGIEKLLNVCITTPSFGDSNNQEEMRHKLISSNAMVAYLEACQFKFACSLAVLRKVEKPQHRLSAFLEFTKDGNGLPQTILRLPSSEGSFLSTDGFVSVAHRQDPSGTSDSPSRYARLDEFDDEFDEEFDGVASPAPARQTNAPRTDLRDARVSLPPDQVIGWCRAKFHFAARDDQELGLNPGDVVSIYRKTSPEWWEGELKGNVGHFPANYVEEF